MRKMFTLFLALAMVVSCLTACGCTASQDSTGEQSANGSQSDSATAGNDSSTSGTGNGNSASSGSQDTGTDSGVGNTGDMGNSSDPDPDNGNSILDDAGDAIENGMNDVENALDGTDSTARRRANGISYEQMLKNAHVHDKDGDLTDHENSVSKQLF